MSKNLRELIPVKTVITHICFSLFESGIPEMAPPNPLVRRGEPVDYPSRETSAATIAFRFEMQTGVVPDNTPSHASAPRRRSSLTAQTACLTIPHKRRFEQQLAGA